PNETSSQCPRKPSKGEMVAALCRHADIDPDDHFPNPAERERLEKLAMALAGMEIMPPSAIIDSGNGLQALWAVSRELLTPETAERIEQENRAIGTALGAVGTHDVARLLRLPGTINYPNRSNLRRGR